jgi:large subunit ribosomal protein L10
VSKAKKEKFVAALEDVYRQSSVFVAHYHGLTVSEINELRSSLRAKNGEFKVVKNTLSKIALSKVGMDMSVLFSGPTAIAYSTDPVGIAKTIVEFSNSNDNFKIVGGILDNHLLSADDVQKLAKLPSLDELRAKIIGLLQAPAVKIAGVLEAPAAQIVRVLQAYASKN